MVFQKRMKRCFVRSSHAVSSIAMTTPDTGKGVGGKAENVPRVKQVALRFLECQLCGASSRLMSQRQAASECASGSSLRDRKGAQSDRVAALLVLCAGKDSVQDIKAKLGLQDSLSDTTSLWGKKSESMHDNMLLFSILWCEWLLWTLVQNYNVTHSRRPKVTPKGWCSLLDAPPILSLFCLPSCSRWHIWNCAFAYQGTTPYDVWSVLGFAFAQGMPKTWFMHGFARWGKSF